jgi:hypothetical protein
MAGPLRTSFRYDVFLSHSSADKPVVRELAERLRDAGLRVWRCFGAMPTSIGGPARIGRRSGGVCWRSRQAGRRPQP